MNRRLILLSSLDHWNWAQRHFHSCLDPVFSNSIQSPPTALQQLLDQSAVKLVHDPAALSLSHMATDWRRISSTINSSQPAHLEMGGDNPSGVSYKQQLRFAISGLCTRDLEQPSVAAARVVLRSLRSQDRHLRAALLDILTGAGCSCGIVALLFLHLCRKACSPSAPVSDTHRVVCVQA